MLKKISKKDIAIWLYASFFIGINFLRIFDSVYQGDEILSVTIIKHSVSEIISITAGDVHPPLHYLILHLCWRIFGDVGWIYHLAVYLPYAITVLLCLTIVKRRFGYISSVVTITLASLTGNAVRFNMEIRMYSMMALFCFLSYLFLYEIIRDEKKQRKNYIWFCVFSLCAAYTQYYAIITVAFFYLALLIWEIYKYHKITKEVIFTYLGTIIGYLPWFSILVKTFLAKSAEGMAIFHIPSLLECCWFVFTNYKLFCIFLIAVLVFMLYDLKIVRIDGKSDNRFRRIVFGRPQFQLSCENMMVIAGILSMVGTLAFGEAISHFIRPLFYTRYAYGATTILFLAFGICISKLHFRKVWCVLLTIFIFQQCFAPFLMTWRDERDTRACYNYFIGKMEVGTNNLMYVNEWPMYAFVEQYFPEANYIEVEENKPLLQQLEERKEPVYLILNDEIPQETIEQAEKDGYSIVFIYAGLLCYDMQYGYYAAWGY